MLLLNEDNTISRYKNQPFFVYYSQSRRKKHTC
jgi:hypothetical protein